MNLLADAERGDGDGVLVDPHVALFQLRTRRTRGFGTLDAVAIAVNAGGARRIDAGATFVTSLLAR